FVLRESCCQSERRCSAIRWRRVSRKRARDEAGLLLVLGFQLLKHRRHCAWVVTRCIHVLNTQLVCFFFGAAAKLHENSEQADAGSILINHSRDAAEEYRT